MYPLPSCTLVTCSYCFHNATNTGVRTADELLASMETFLTIPTYMVIYCDATMAPRIRTRREALEFISITRIIEAPFESLWCYPFLEKVRRNREVYWPTRDARTNSETHLIQCNKFDFVLSVLRENPFSTEKFAWIDCCCPENMRKMCEDYTHAKLMYILQNISDKFHIQALNVCDKKYMLTENKREYYETYRWVVCGGFFTCGQKSGEKILNMLKENVGVTTNMGYGHGEEMFYLEVLDDPDMIFSYGDYGQILNNFIAPTRNIRYILDFIARNYMYHCYYKECYRCCEIVLRQIENYEISVDYDVYFGFLFCLYVSGYYYHGRERGAEIVQHIRNLISVNPHIRQEFEKQRDFYEAQFIHVQ